MEEVPQGLVEQQLAVWPEPRSIAMTRCAGDVPDGGFVGSRCLGESGGESRDSRGAKDRAYGELDAQSGPDPRYQLGRQQECPPSSKKSS